MPTKLIIEASIVNQNKIFLSRMVNELKRQANKKGAVNVRTISYIFDDKNYKTTVKARMEVSLSDIKLAEAGNMLYILGVPKFKISCSYYDYLYSYNTNRDIEEQVLDFIKCFARVDTLPYISEQLTKNSLVAAGLEEIDTNNDSAIKSSNIFKTLVSHAKEVEKIEVHSTLNSEVAKKLKERENVIPLMWLDAKEEMLNYPHKCLGGARNPTSGANRFRIRLSSVKESTSDIEIIANKAIVFTPYDTWLWPYTNDKVSDEVRHFL